MTASQRESKITDMSTPAVEMKFPYEMVIELLDSQAEKMYVRLWKADKYGKQADKCKTTVRMANGHTQEIN